MTEKYTEVKAGSLKLAELNDIEALALFLFRANKLGVTTFQFNEKTLTMSFTQSQDVTGTAVPRA